MNPVEFEINRLKHLNYHWLWGLWHSNAEQPGNIGSEVEKLLQKYPALDKEADPLAWTAHMNMLTAMAEECVMNNLAYR